MKTAISIPNSIFEAAEKLAQQFGISRSQLYANAVAEYLRDHQNDGVTEKLNEIYKKESSELDPICYAFQFSSIQKDEW
jgi:metal-responsive CopG/Arc/MetJ family transcriptional regulator